MNTVVHLDEIQKKYDFILSKINSGDEIILEDSGKQLAKIVPIKKKRILGKEKGRIFISKDFDDELPEDILKEFYK